MLLISLVACMRCTVFFRWKKKIPAIVGYLTSIGIESVILAGKNDLVVLILVLGFLAMMVSYVATYPKFTAEEIAKINIWNGICGIDDVIYFQTRINNDGAYTVWLIFISAWGYETCAYLVGRAIGKHKMTPVLSPKKSIEGAVGGIIGSALIGALYGTIFKTNLTEFSNPAVFCAIIGACGGFISMFGDLSASAIKRQYQIKDYGNLIPGHGGIMDRFDSIIFTAPLIYILVTLLQRIA